MEPGPELAVTLEWVNRLRSRASLQPLATLAPTLEESLPPGAKLNAGLISYKSSLYKPSSCVVRVLLNLASQPSV